MSTFKFKELKDAADEVRFKDKYKHQLSEFQEEIRKLEDAILEADKTKYDATIKNIRQLIGNRTHGSRFKEFDEKLKELESKVKKGVGFTSVIIETKTDESGAVGGRNQSKESGSMDCGTDKRVGGRIKSSDSSSSFTRRQGTERKRTKAETPRELGSVKEVTENDECRIEIEKLTEKLENACKDNSIPDNTDKKSSNVGTKEKRSPIKQQFDRVNEQADRIIARLEMTRGMSNVKGIAQDKLVKNATDNVEREAKARMEKVITCLKKLKEQIDANKVDVQEFQKLEGSQEEKQIKAFLEDICVKVKNIRDTGKGKSVGRGAKLQQQVDELWNLTFDLENNTKGNKGDEDNLLNMLEKMTPEIKKLKDLQTVMEKEVTALNDDIAKFDDPIEPSIAKVSQKHPGILNDILNARKQLYSKKIDVAKQIKDRKSAGRGAKLQQQVDELWNLTFDLESNTKVKGDEENLLNMLEKITPEIKNLKYLQKLMEMEVTALNDDIAKFDDPTEPSIAKVSPKHPGILNNILNARKQLNSKKIDVAKQIKDRRSVGRGAKLQQHVDELWNLTFETEKNTKGNKCDEDNLLNMLEKITQEIKKLKDLQTAIDIEIKALNDDVAKFDDPTEPSIGKVSSKHPGIPNDILNARKQLNSKKIDVAKQIKDSREDKNKEISTLKQHVITLWQLTSGTDNEDNDSGLSSLLENIILQIKDEKNKQEEARKEKINLEQAIKDLWKRIYPDKIRSDEGVTNALDDITKYATDTQKKLDEFDRIEEFAFKVEKNAHNIYFELTCSKYPYPDDPQTTVGILEKSLEILKSCFSETKASVKEINTLEEVLRSQSNSTLISKRCNWATQKVKGWVEIHEKTKSLLDWSVETLSVSYTQLLGEAFHFHEPKQIEKSTTKRLPDWLQNIKDAVAALHACIEYNKNRFVSQERLVEEREKLHKQIKQLEADKDSVYNRLSKVAGARLTDNNPNIADLSDPNRPTKIAEQYSELYDSPWTDAFESLKKEEQENTEFLLKIIVDCYEMCGQISKNHQQKLQRAVCFPAGDIESPQPSKANGLRKEKSISFSAVQSKALSELRKQTADISVDDVKSHIKSEQTKWFVTKDLEKYTTICIELCWLMHVQTPPVVIDTSAKHGTKFDTNRYKQYTKAGKKIDFVVWPVLLLEEGGAILCKGVAQGK